MMSFCEFLKSTIGKKYLVGITGLAVSAFSLSHMLGNLLILVSADAYNRYSHALITNPAIIPIELALAAVFIVHLGVALNLAWSNRSKRGTGYAVAAREKGSTFAAKTMVLSGLLLLVFLVLHLITFKYGTEYTATVDGVVMRDLHRLVIEKFSEPLYCAYYLFSMAVLCLHLSHGVSAAFQSLGLASSLSPRLKRAGWGFAALVAGGFAAQPLWVFLRMRG